MKKTLLLGIILMVMIVPTVKADVYASVPLQGICLTNTTLVKSINYTEDGVMWTPFSTENITCPFGCVDNATTYGAACADNDPIKAGFSGVLMMGFAVFMIIMAKITTKPINTMFIFIALFTIVSSIWMGSLITSVYYPGISSLFITLYNISIISLSVVFVYLFYEIFVDAYNYVTSKTGKKGKV